MTSILYPWKTTSIIKDAASVIQPPKKGGNGQGSGGGSVGKGGQGNGLGKGRGNGGGGTPPSSGGGTIGGIDPSVPLLYYTATASTNYAFTDDLTEVTVDLDPVGYATNLSTNSAGSGGLYVGKASPDAGGVRPLLHVLQDGTHDAYAFDGSNDFADNGFSLMSGAGSVTSATVYQVVEFITLTTSDGVLGTFGAAGAAGTGDGVYFFNPGSGIVLVNSVGAAGADIGSVTITTGQKYIITTELPATSAGSANSVYLDYDADTITRSSNNTFTFDGNTKSGLVSSSNEGHQYEYAYLLYDGIHDASTRLSVCQALATEYGITL
jgi:hypothetical protein